MILLGTSLIGTALWVSIPRTAKNAVGADAVCIFVNDDANRAVLQELASLNIRIQPKLQPMGVSVENIALKTESCTLANLDNFVFSYQKEQIDKLQFNYWGWIILVFPVSE